MGRGLGWHPRRREGELGSRQAWAMVAEVESEQVVDVQVTIKSPAQVFREQHCIYVSNLVYSLAASSLESAFTAQGCEVAHVEVLSKGRGSSKTGAGLAVVTLKTPADKVKAMQVLDGKLLYGRPMVLRDDKFV